MTHKLRPGEPDWPRTLDEGIDPPVRCLYVEGRTPDPESAHVAIVGTRRPTAAGVAVAKKIATGLALQGYAIVSGLAVGIDAIAHQAALDAGGSTIAVLGCGHAIDYPKRNRALRRQIAIEGSVLSEYGPDVQPKPFMFPLRNRIIAGLSLAVVVVEGTIKSGALVTGRLALDANREVFAVPGSARNVMAEGPNELIRRGEAALVTSADHVLESLSGVTGDRAAPGVPRVEMTAEQETVLSYLDDAPVSVDGFVRALQLAAPDVAKALSMLELNGFARRTLRGYVITEAGAAQRRGCSVEGVRDA